MLCVFDVNETLLDLSPLDAVFAELTGSPDARREWFDLVIHTALTVTATGGYADFAEIAGACTASIATRYGKPATDQDRKAVGTAMRSLPAHHDASSALTRLRAAGLDLVVLANSPLATVEQQLHNAGLTSQFDRIFSAEQAGALKPAAALPPGHREPTRSTRTQRSWSRHMAGTSPGPTPLACARRFLERPGKILLPGSPPPTMSAGDLDALAGQIIDHTAATS
ncbi:MAG: HAD family hydrolase [Nocardioidaceae bacterium]